MSGLLREKDWEILIRRIKGGKCTPFLGAGAGSGVLPLGSQIAEEWAKKYGYPLEDKYNLVSVAQFLALERDPMFPKELIVEMFEEFRPPDLTDPFEPHRVLASFPLPLYVTTNYDDFMVQALTRQLRNSERVLCQWNKSVKNYTAENPTVFEKEPGFVPTAVRPVVFHLHGHVPLADSLVLTEDDYMDYLVNIAGDPGLIPPQIARALTGTSLLFIGYRLADWNFRVLLRSFKRFMERSVSSLNVAVMLAPAASESTQHKAEEYLTAYYENIDVRVYWGTVRDFVKELQERWVKFSNEN